MSRGVIEDFVEDQIREAASSTEEEYEDLVEGDIAYDIYPLKETNCSLKDLNNDFYNNEDDFLKKYKIN